MKGIHVVNESDAGRVEARRALSRVDLNVLVHLDALLTERSVTRAAERLCLSQPAMSSALGRLRAHFDDELLIREGRGWRLSALGARLAPPTAQMVEEIHGILEMSADFDPSRESREFVVHASDHSASVIGQAVRNRVSAEAPDVRLTFMNRQVDPEDPPGALLANCDAAVLPHGILFDSPHLDLFGDQWMCIVASDHPDVGEVLTAENLSTLPWVAAHRAPYVTPVLGQHLARIGVRPRVDTVVDSFLATPYFVAGSPRIGVVQRRLFERIPPSLNVRAVRTPFDIPPHEVALWWHPTREHDPAHRWLRLMFASASRDV